MESAVVVPESALPVRALLRKLCQENKTEPEHLMNTVVYLVSLYKAQSASSCGNQDVNCLYSYVFNWGFSHS